MSDVRSPTTSFGAAVVVALCAAAPALASDEGPPGRVEVALGHALHRAPSVANRDLPMRLEDPSLLGAFPVLELGWLVPRERFNHRVRLDTHWPGRLRFRDGSGRDRVLVRERSWTFDLALGYGFDYWVVRRPAFRLGLGGLATAAYHREKLSYQSGGGTTRVRDLSVGLGLSLPAELRLGADWRARAELANVFHMPWLSTGAVNRLGAAAPYRLSAWRTRLDLEIARRIGAATEVALAYAREEALGYGVSTDGRSTHLAARNYANHLFLARARLEPGRAAP